MLYYRLYFMSARTGHIERFVEYDSPDDAAAMALARDREGRHALELWCGHRKVGRIEPSDPASGTFARPRPAPAGRPGRPGWRLEA